MPDITIFQAPLPSDGYANNMKVLYSASKPLDSARKTTRHIPQVDIGQIGRYWSNM